MPMRNWTRWAALGSVGGLAVCSSAAAQSAMSIVDQPGVASAPAHYSVNATFSAAYESNTAGGTAAVAALRGLKQADYIFAPTVTVDLFRPIGRESVFVGGSVGYNFYDQNTQLNRENINLSGGLNGQLSACRGTLTGAYVRRQNEITDVTLGKIQDLYDQSTVGLNAACGRGVGLEPTLSVSQTWSNNSQVQLTTSDYNTLSVNGGVAYTRPTFGNLSLFGLYQKTDFSNRFVQFGARSIQDGFDTYGGGVRYVRQLGARIQGTVSLSYTSVKPYVGQTGNFSGPTYGADITYRASSRLQFHGSVDRDVQPSNTFDSTYLVETKGAFDANYSVGSRLNFSVGVSEQSRNFKGATIKTAIDLKSDEVKSIYGSASYKLRRLSLTLDVRNDLRTANIPGLGYSDTRVSLTTGTRF